MSFQKVGRFLLLLIIVNQSVTVFSQDDPKYLDYISQYTQSAITEMYFSKIPASIIMAQALHESRFGTSELAINAKNHFGIKCQSGWTGKTYTYQDDDDNTCFRLYNSVSESYRDHSNFLMTRPRYAPLFQLDPTDYEGWAKGLKKCGYATNPNYAAILIKLIEDYKLYMLDTMQPVMEPMKTIANHRVKNNVTQASPIEPRIYRRNRIEFTVARLGDNIDRLSREYGVFRWEIRRYNEIGKDEDVQPGQVVFLQPKRKRAESGYTLHTAEDGETMYSISQMYGIKLKWLYKRNRMESGTQPMVGQEVWLRGMKPVNKVQ